MPTWTPTTEPATFVAGRKARASHWNDVRDRIAYHKGALSPDGTFIRLTAAATAGALSLATEDLPAAVPAGAVLYFRSGAAAWAKTTQPAEAGENTLTIEALAQDLPDEDEAAWPQQDVVEVEAPIKVASAIGGQAEQDRLRHRLTHATIAAYYSHIARKVAATADADHVDLIFGAKNNSGEELYCRIRFFRDGSANRGSIYITPANGAGFGATPAVAVLGTGRIAVANTVANHTLDITGDLDVTGELIGIALWKESPSGTLNHTGSIRITGQLISTVATGTAPFTAGPNAGMVRNLNVSLWGGLDWFDGPDTNTGTVSVVTKNTDYTVCSQAAVDTALCDITGEATVDVASADRGALFTLDLKVGGVSVATQVGSVRSSTARKVPVSVFGSAHLTGGGTAVVLVARKDNGTGSSSTAGSLKVTPFGV